MRELYYHHRELSQAAGAKKPSESQKSESPLGNESGLVQGEEFYDPVCEEDILGRTTTRLELWEEHLKDPLAALAKALGCLENPYLGWHLVLSLPTFVVEMAVSIVGAKILQNMWEGLHWEGVWLDLDPWDVVRLRTSSCF